MRTTIVLPEPILARVRELAKRDEKPLSAILADALEVYLLKAEQAEPSGKPPVSLQTFSMGEPSVDVNDREKLCSRMEE